MVCVIIIVAWVVFVWVGGEFGLIVRHVKVESTGADNVDYARYRQAVLCALG